MVWALVAAQEEARRLEAKENDNQFHAQRFAVPVLIRAMKSSQSPWTLNPKSQIFNPSWSCLRESFRHRAAVMSGISHRVENHPKMPFPGRFRARVDAVPTRPGGCLPMIENSSKLNNQNMSIRENRTYTQFVQKGCW